MERDFQVIPVIDRSTRADGAGFEETSAMTEDYVATMFQKTVDFRKPEDVEQAVQWCRQQFGV